MNNNISIIIPAFNAAHCIASTLQRTRRVFGEEIEIIIVVNESAHKTLKAIEDIVSKDNQMRVLHFDRRLGKGRAILEGFKIAQGRIWGFLDSDGPFNLSAIKENLNLIDSGMCDCIICSKWFGRSFRQVDQRFFRKILSRLFNFIVRNWLNLNFIDTQAGAKFLRKEVFTKVGYNFICSGFDFDVELLKRLLLKGARIEEVYVPHYRNNNSTVSAFREAPSIIFNLCRLKRSVWKKR